MSKVIISGGGTGGHVFPAIAIGHALRRMHPDMEILFVGALGRLEMTEVPKAGFAIEGLPVMGLPRKLSPDLLKFPVKLVQSLFKASAIIRKFRPDAVVGVGGYSSGPALRMAAMVKIPFLIQEQNSYPGATNLLLAKKAAVICVAYPGMERYFPKEKIVFTGNPVRKDLIGTSSMRTEAASFFDLDPAKKTLLVLGGSGGAVTINRTIVKLCKELKGRQDIQLIWQTGRRYFDVLKNDTASDIQENVKIVPFIDRMDLAFAIADLVVSRAGAIAISELCLLGMPSILIPSPNVTGDHQRKNAKVLSDRGAAILVEDAHAEEVLPLVILATLSDPEKMNLLKKNILELATPDADDRIAREVINLINKKR